jgi:hypothetical protein
MTLIMKQVYEEKEIEVGIWRTLGAGGVRIDASSTTNKTDMSENINGFDFEHNPLKQKLNWR